MKKLFLFMVAAFAMLATSCQRDEIALDASGEGFVEFRVSTEDMATRAYSDGLSAKNLEYVVYDANWAYVLEGATTFPANSLETTVQLRLVNGKTYNIVFWASAPRETEPYYTFDKVNASLKINYLYANTFSQDETRDAFFHTEPNLSVNGGIQKDIVLKRPFAQLNVATADYADAVKAGVTVDQTQMKVDGIYSTLSFKDGSVSGPASVTYRMADIPNGDNETLTTKSGQSYRWLSMNYILVEPQKQLVKCTMITEEGDVSTKVWDNVPVRRNWRTNIIGNILTSSVEFNVEINPNYDGEYEYSAWDGSYAELPAADANGYITIKTADQLATLLNMDPDGLKIKLGADIDMNGRDLPVYADAAKGNNDAFELDGQGYTIYNVAPKAEGKYNGLFPVLVEATIKNLYIDGAQVMPAATSTRATTGDFYAGALVGATYGNCVFENVVVTNSSVQGVNKVGGLIGFVAENGVDVDKCVVAYSNVGTFSTEDGGCVGGLIGYIAGKSHTIDNSKVNNTNIVAINSANEAKRANSEFIGVFEGGEGANLFITGCEIAANNYQEDATSYVAPEGYKGLVGGMRFEGGSIIIDGVVADGTLPEPEFVGEPTEWGVVGDLTGWGSTADIVMYTTETENLFVAKAVVYTTGGFKIRANNEWNDAKNYGGHDSPTTIAVNGGVDVYTSGGSQNMVIETAGTYDIYFYLAGEKVYVMEEGLVPELQEPVEPLENVWSIVGSFNNWTPTNGIVMEEALDGWYVAYAVEFADAAEFKFVLNGDWGGDRGSNGSYELGVDAACGDANVAIAAGTYDIYFSPYEDKFRIETEYVEPTPVPVFTVAAEWAEGVEVAADFESVVVGNIANYNAETVQVTVDSENLEVAVAENGDVVVTRMAEFAEGYEGKVVVTIDGVATEVAFVVAAPEVKITTVEEFLAAAEDDTIYTLSGTITAVANTTYGNFDLTDDTGTVLIYGLCSPEGESKYWATSGAKVGDDITIKTVRTSFNGTAQGKNALFVELLPGTRACWTLAADKASFAAEGGEKSIDLAIYNTDAEVNCTSNNAQFSASYADGKITIVAAANETEEAVNGEISVECGALAATITVSQKAKELEQPTYPEATIAYDDFDADAYYTFKKVDYIAPNRFYAIVADNNAATMQSGNYGYLYNPATPEVKGEYIVLPATAAYYFAEADGGYTIEQADGRKLYQTGTYNNFNFSAAPTAGHIWSVAIDENGAYTITNNSVEKFIQWDPSYSSYGSYATLQGVLPTLYEIVAADTTPRIVSVSATSLSFDWDDAAEKAIIVATYGDATLNAEASEAWVSVDVVDGNVVVAVENNTESARSATVTITYGAASTPVAISQGDKPKEDTDEVVKGGQDDFNTISATNTSYVSGSTTAGWAYENCAIFKGGTSDSSPAFVMIGDADNRALCMNGKTSAVGSIVSPIFATGCGTLTFNYGLPFGDTKIKFSVDIIQNGEVVKTITIENMSATKCTVYSHEWVVNVAGDFSLKFTNLSPSNSTSNKDRTAIWDVVWTGYAN